MEDRSTQEYFRALRQIKNAFGPLLDVDSGIIPAILLYVVKKKSSKRGTVDR